MAEIYVTGHRNPDMDSICSAIGYANLKSLTDPGNDYIPVRCSHLGESTKLLLNKLSIPTPRYLRDCYPKVADVMLSTEVRVEADAPVTDYARLINEMTPSATPVFDRGRFLGLITMDDVMLWSMGRLARDGKILEIPTVRSVMRDQTLTLQASDLFDDAKEKLLASTKRGLAVFRDEEFVGFVTRRCFLNEPKYNVILVDHNETSQSVKGVETANVVEIIDHHRLNAMKTTMPLFIDAEPLGSTCTIVHQLYLRNGIRPDRETARILLTGILTDTLILRSPTTTQIDVESAATLSAMCRLDAAEYGRNIFSHVARLKDRDPETAILSDFKSYTEGELRIGIGQCEVTTLDDLEEYRAIYCDALETVRRKNGLDWALLMVTNIIKEQSVLFSTVSRAEQHLPYLPLNPHVYDMPGILSRKKQLLPEILHAVSQHFPA